MSILVPVLALGIGIGAFSILYTSTGSAAPAAPADPNPDCNLTVPANPLSAKGLATPWLLSATDPAQGPCDEANTAQSAFVEATVLDPFTGALSVYRPLVVDKGSQPAAPDVVPNLPRNAIVGLYIGFNGGNLTLVSTDHSIRAGRCVSGTRGSIFGQVSYCNAPLLFAAANWDIRRGLIKIPALGTGRDGLPCMTTRDYGLIDQDQSDNVITSYLVLPDGSVAQNTAANAARLPGASTLVNGSDNLLLDGFVDPALGCNPWTVTDLTNPTGPKVGSMALDELFAAARQAAPVALVPENDPMTMTDGKVDVVKTDLYRAGADQPPYNPRTESPARYCTNMLTIGAQRIEEDKSFFLTAPSPDPAAANSLYTFMAQRWSGSLTNLSCSTYTTVPANPVTLTTDADGVVTDAVFPDPAPTKPSQGAPAGNGDSTSANHAHHRPHKY